MNDRATVMPDESSELGATSKVHSALQALNRPPLLVRYAMMVLCAIVCAVSARAQCPDVGWRPGDGVQGINGVVKAMVLWDPDGPGPAPRRLVVGGNFALAGSTVVQNVAMWNGSQWLPVGFEITGEVRALVVLQSGELVAGGDIRVSGNLRQRNVAKWSDGKWLPFATGTRAAVNAFAILPNGDLIAGGDFSPVNSPEYVGIARWNGSTWSAIGDFQAHPVFSVAVLPNGDLVATSGGIARWDGERWSNLGSASGEAVYSIAVSQNGDIVASGSFSNLGGIAANSIARWNGSGWSPLGQGLGFGPEFAIPVTIVSNGDVIAAGNFTIAGGAPVPGIARWDGHSWHALGSGLTGIARAVLEMPDGTIVVAGEFLSAGGVPLRNIAVWDGLVWSPLGRGTNDSILALAKLPNGDLIAGGDFQSVGGVVANRIARWNGSSWSPLGAGVNDEVRAVAFLPNGDVIAGGLFTAAGGIPANRIARWNGASWSPLGAGMDHEVNALAVTPNGDLFAGGAFGRAGGRDAFRVARWNGSQWFAVGNGANAEVLTLLPLANGDLVAGGWFSFAGGVRVNCVARWNGSSWSAFGAGVSDFSMPIVASLAEMPNGDIVAGGRFQLADGVAASNIARWNGSTWVPLGEGLTSFDTFAVIFVGAMTSLPNGDLVAGGYYSASGPLKLNHVALWNGQQWTALGSGFNYATSTSKTSVAALTTLPNGDVVAGGRFTVAGGTNAAYLARHSFSGITSVAEHPKSQSVLTNVQVVLSATPAAGYSSIRFEWRRNGVPISNGPEGSSPGGGTVSGAVGELPSPTHAEPAVLTISEPKRSDAGDYSIVFTSACGATESMFAAVKVKSHIADLNADGVVDDADFSIFVLQYDTMLCADEQMTDGCSADFNGDGRVDDSDFALLVPAYNAMMEPKIRAEHSH